MDDASTKARKAKDKADQELADKYGPNAGIIITKRGGDVPGIQGQNIVANGAGTVTRKPAPPVGPVPPVKPRKTKKNSSGGK
jgi:hypothetical protein